MKNELRLTVYNQNLSNQNAKETTNYIKKRSTRKGCREPKLLNYYPCFGNVVRECSEAQYQKTNVPSLLLII